MSLFRRKDEATTPSAPEPTSVPTARDPDLAVPPFRPAAAVVPPVASAAAASAKPTITPSPAARPSAPAAGRPTGRTEAGEKRVLQLGKGISIQGSVTEAERIVIEGTMESQLLQCQELAISHSGVMAAWNLALVNCRSICLVSSVLCCPVSLASLSISMINPLAACVCACVSFLSKFPLRR